MTNLVTVNNGQVVVSSRQVAENFGKRHDDVLKAIRNLEEDVRTFAEMFFESTMPDTYSRPQKIYLMNKKGFSLLAMGFTGSKAIQWKLKYIEAFEAMEKQLYNPFRLPQTFAEALQLAAEQARQLEEAKPAVSFVERYVSTDNTKSIREVAKILGIRERLFIALLEDADILYRSNGVLVPFATHQHNGYFEVKTGEANNKAFHWTRFTTEGIEWISRLARKGGWESNG